MTVEKDVKRKREIIKKVIAYMTLGIDVSRLFSEMVLCVDTKDLISKKMVYLYLTNYANKNSELAIMCINTLLNDWCASLSQSRVSLCVWNPRN